MWSFCNSKKDNWSQVIITNIIMKKSERVITTKMWHRDTKWANAAGENVTNRPVSQRIVIKKKKTLSAKHNEAKCNKKRYACIPTFMFIPYYDDYFSLCWVLKSTNVRLPGFFFGYSLFCYSQSFAFPHLKDLLLNIYKLPTKLQIDCNGSTDPFQVNCHLNNTKSFNS